MKHVSTTACRFVIWLALAGGVFPALRSSATPCPTDQQVAAYRDLYKASVIRSLRFADEPDPLAAIREEIFLEAELAKRAADEGVTSDPLLQADIRHYQTQEILNTILESRVPADSVTTAELEQYYREHLKDFSTTELVRFRHIFFLVPKGDARAEKTKFETAKKVKEKLDKGGDFAALAAEYSDLASARRNKGFVGPEKLSKLNPSIQSVLVQLQPGEIAGPVRTPYGWEILKLEERIPARQQSLGEVAEQIRQQLRRDKARDLQAQIAEEMNRRFPAQINNKLLETSGPLPRDAWVFAVGGTTYTVERVLADIYATWSYHNIQDERERIRAALPRLIETQQALLFAREHGLFDDPMLATKLQLIHNRLAGERYWRGLSPKEKPTEKELKEHYSSNPDVFRTPPEAKGTLFKWKLESGKSTTMSVEFMRESLRSKVTELRKKAENGELSLEQLRKEADEVQDLDWFREGPNGYLFDKAFFSAKAKSFTEVFDQRDGVAFGWVEARKEPQPLPFEKCREWVERRLTNLRADEMRRKLVDEILAQYARTCR